MKRWELNSTDRGFRLVVRGDQAARDQNGGPVEGAPGKIGSSGTFAPACDIERGAVGINRRPATDGAPGAGKGTSSGGDQDIIRFTDYSYSFDVWYTFRCNVVE